MCSNDNEVDVDDDEIYENLYEMYEADQLVGWEHERCGLDKTPFILPPCHG